MVFFVIGVMVIIGILGSNLTIGLALWWRIPSFGLSNILIVIIGRSFAALMMLYMIFEAFSNPSALVGMLMAVALGGGVVGLALSSALPDFKYTGRVVGVWTVVPLISLGIGYFMSLGAPFPEAMLVIVSLGAGGTGALCGLLTENALLLEQA